jgi:hypothetical protein
VSLCLVPETLRVQSRYLGARRPKCNCKSSRRGGSASEITFCSRRLSRYTGSSLGSGSLLAGERVCMYPYKTVHFPLRCAVVCAWDACPTLHVSWVENRGRCAVSTKAQKQRWASLHPPHFYLVPAAPDNLDRRHNYASGPARTSERRI